MTQLGISIAWLVLSPLALLTNIVAIVVVCHYQGQFHGTDVAFLSLFVTMMMEAVAVVPVPAVLGVLEEDWKWSELCSGYVWLVLCVRMSDLLVTLIVNVHWMCILRFTSGQEVYSSSTTVKIFVIIAWVAAAVTGVVPVVGYSFYAYFHEVTSKELVAGEGNSAARLVTVVTRECHFLPEGLGTSFVLFFILLTLAILTLSLVASLDTLTVFHYMRKTAVHKYKAGRFYLPSTVRLDTAAANRNSEAQGTETRSTRLSLSQGEEGFNRTKENQAVEGSNHQNNGDISVIHRNGNIPGEGGGHSTSASTSTEDNVSRSPDGNIPASAEGVPATLHSGSMYGNGASGSASAGGGRRAVRSAATVVVRPSEKSGVAKSHPHTVHARYNELNLSAELCRLVFCYTLLAALLNHLPFVVLQFLQLVQDVDRQHAETTLLWLTLAHSLAMPHVLWMLSRRYRHALAYTWNVHLRRDQSAKEEDPSACTLQSYTRKTLSPEGGTMKVMARSRGREPITMATYNSSVVTEGQPNGNAIGAGGSPHSSPLVHGTWTHEANRNPGTKKPLPNLIGQRSRTEVMTTDLDDGMTIVTNLASRQVTYIYNTPPDPSPNTQASSERQDNNRKMSEDQSISGVPAEGQTNSDVSPPGREAHSESGRNSAVSLEGRGNNNSRASSPASASPSRSSLGTPTRGSTDINRSSSARNVWKEKMMKKHLPAIFINEAFESDEMIHEERVSSEVSQLPDVAQVTVEARTQSSSDDKNKKSKDPQFHYYMSGGFHYDYLRSDSMPRMESESDGGSFQYDDNDIEGILDREHSMRSQRVTPSMSTFRADSQGGAPADDTKNVKAAPLALNTRDGVAPDSGADATVFSSGTWPVSESRPQNEDSESGSLARTPGNRKPRRSAVLKHSSRPSLQHQRSLHADPEVSGESVPVENETDSEHVSSNSAHIVQNSLADRTFYPSFEPTAQDSEVTHTSDVSEGHKEADRDGGCGNYEKQPSSVVLTNSSQSRIETEPYDQKVVDTDDVFISIENVTTDATHTDTFGSDTFVPQGQASVLGILLEDGTEIPAQPELQHNSLDTPLSRSHNHVQDAEEFDPISEFSASPISPSNPFTENDHEHVADSQTNPFFADFNRDRHASTRSELSPLTGHNQSVSSHADSHNLPSVADDTDSCRDADQHTSFSENDPFRRDPFDVGADEASVVRHSGSEGATTPDSTDAVDTNSLNSEPSVVLEPYTEDRKPPWMDAEYDHDMDSASSSPRKKSRNPFRASFDADDPEALGSSEDFGSSFGSNSEIRIIFSNQNKTDSGNPFASDPFSDKLTDEADSVFPQSSVDSGQLYVSESNGSTSYQSYPFFDEETDRGFEDALALENVMDANPYGGFIQRFESIEEEPEDFIESAPSLGQEGTQESYSAGVSQDLSVDSGAAQLPETNPFQHMNGNSSQPSSSSNPSPVFASTNPFSPHTSPQRSFPFDSSDQTRPVSDKETVSLQSPLFNEEPVHPNEETPATGISEEFTITPPPAPRIRLTKPVRWKSKDKPNENESASDGPTSRSAVVGLKGLDRGRTNSEEHNSDGLDSGVGQTKYEGVFAGNDGDGPVISSDYDQGSHQANRPPVPPRPSKEGKVELHGEESSADYFDPVFF